MSNVKYFFPDKLIETQQQMMSQFMEGWTDLANNQMASMQAAANQQASQKHYDIESIMNRILKASQNYFDMAERFAGASKDGVTTQTVLTNWINQMMQMAQQTMSQDFSEMDAFGASQHPFWDMPQDTMNRTMSTLFPFPGDFFRAFRPEGLSRMPGNIHGQLDQFLAMPSIGYTRESQDKYKKLNRLMLAYQKALHDYNVAMAKVTMEALTAFQHDAMTAMNEADSALSFKDLHNIWTQAAERVYGAYVMTEDYTEMYGSLVNKMMAVKQQTARIMDEMFEAMNIPTRKEMNTLNKRVQEVRRQSDITLANEIEGLKARIDQLEKQLSDGEKSAPAKNQSASKASPSPKAEAQTPSKKSTKKTTKKAGAKKSASKKKGTPKS